MKHVAAAALIVAALAPAARAGAAVKAKLVCTPDGGKPLADGAKHALDKDITCAIVVDGDGKLPDGALATIGATLVSPIGLVGGPVRQTKAGDDKVTLTATEPFHHGGDFVQCAPVLFQGTIATGTKELWKASIKVVPSCATPALDPKLAAVSCMADASKGTLSFPGNGDHAGAELRGGMTCQVAVAPDRPDAAAAKVAALAVHGAGASLRLLATQQGSKTPIGFVQFMGNAIPKCKSFAIDAAVLRADGATLWKGSVPIAQTCAKGAK